MKRLRKYSQLEDKEKTSEKIIKQKFKIDQIRVQIIRNAN